MPIAATLSRKLYETFGDEAAEAMVDWMHRVDTQRAELRELSELSFSRIDSRFAEADAKLDVRFADVNARFADVTAQVTLCRAELDGRITGVSAELGGRITTACAELGSRLGDKIATRYNDLFKWSFVFWATMLIALLWRTR